MELAAVLHRPTAEFVYPSSRTGLVIRLFAARGDLDEVGLLYWERGETDPERRRKILVRPKLRDAWRDCYEVEIKTEPITAYVRYCFRLRSGKRELWYGPNGFRDTEPGPDEDFFEFLWPNPEDCFKAPDWSSGQVYYQLFPERFKNGDSSLTPDGADAWGSVPTRENFMGGDLRGIREKLPYISALGATCLYLTPGVRGPLEPQIRHGGLLPHRPALRHGGGPARAHLGCACARHPQCCSTAFSPLRVLLAALSRTW